MEIYFQKCWNCQEWVLFRGSEKSICPKCQEFNQKNETAISLEEWQKKNYKTKYYDV